MNLGPVVLLAGLLVLVLLSPWFAACLFDGRAPARIVATFHLLTLVGLAVLPVVVLVCLAVVRTGDADALAVARWVSRGLAAAYVLRLGWVAVRTARATSRAAVTALGAAEPLAGGDTYVLAAPRPLAYALRARAGDAVIVSRGLLAVLDRDERLAVLAHERAHLRLRHHRLLFFGRVVAATLGRHAPAVRRAQLALARELEVIADQEAAGVVGDRRVLARALAKTVLATSTPPPAPAFGDGRDLTYRLDRLTGTRPRQDRYAVAAAAVGLLAAELLVVLTTTFRPPGPAIAVIGGLAAGGVAWLYHRGVRRPTV